MTRKPTDSVTPTEAPISRPLSASDKRNLEKLVKQDFELLRQELHIVRDEIEHARHQEIDQRLEADTKQAAAITAEGQEAVRNLVAQIQELEAKARTYGFEVDENVTYVLARNSYNRFTVSAATVSGEKRKATTEINAEYQRGLLSVNQKETEVLRTVYMAGLTEEANAVLDSIPSARDIMAGVHQVKAVAS